MNSFLRNMMAKMVSYEAAAEFGIPEVTLEEYEAFRRSDDLYVACLASVFDALRLQQIEQQKLALADIAKILVIYSRSAVARHLSGVEKRLNQLYSASLYYLAGFPATATLLARPLEKISDALEEESFLHGFLGRLLNEAHPLERNLLEGLRNDSIGLILNDLRDIFEGNVTLGLQEDPRMFIAAKLSLSCLERAKSGVNWTPIPI